MEARVQAKREMETGSAAFQNKQKPVMKRSYFQAIPLSKKRKLPLAAELDETKTQQKNSSNRYVPRAVMPLTPYDNC